MSKDTGEGSLEAHDRAAFENVAGSRRRAEGGSGVPAKQRLGSYHRMMGILLVGMYAARFRGGDRERS